MKRILLGLFTITSLSLAAVNANAQATFNTEADTVYMTYSGSIGMDAHNYVTAISSSVTLRWKVVSENFTTDATWSDMNGINICDNNNCYTNALNALLSGTEYISDIYDAGQSETFKASFLLGNANSGTHYVTVRLSDQNSTYEKDVTFIVSKWATSTSNVTKNSENVVLYPNPVRDEVNVVFNNLNVRNIAVYNVIGKTMVVYRTAGNSAKMDLGKFPAGVYFLRMSDANGNVVATKRFTKQ